MECYVFSSEQIANDALTYINNFGYFPMVNMNAKTGELQPNKQKTLSYSNIKQRNDGKFYIERLPSIYIEKLDKEIIDYFINNFSPSIETYSNDWEYKEE